MRRAFLRLCCVVLWSMALTFAAVWAISVLLPLKIRSSIYSMLQIHWPCLAETVGLGDCLRHQYFLVLCNRSKHYEPTYFYIRFVLRWEKPSRWHCTATLSVSLMRSLRCLVAGGSTSHCWLWYFCSAILAVQKTLQDLHCAWYFWYQQAGYGLPIVLEPYHNSSDFYAGC